MKAISVSEYRQQLRRSPRAGGDLAEVLHAQIRAAGLSEPVREFRFHHTRRWRFDCAWPDALIACEVDGSEFANGRHSRGLGMAKDNDKLNAAQLEGWVCLRFTGSQVKRGEAVEVIREALQGWPGKAAGRPQEPRSASGCHSATSVTSRGSARRG